MNQPLLTVIVPCYNVEKHIDKCISSIVVQTYSNLEILLINDGSTDQTGVFCNAWQAKDGRIRVIHKQNEGASYARKTGIECATAEYVTFVDADDWIDKNMYADMMSALQSTNSDIAQCDLCIVYEDGRLEHRVEERCSTMQTMGRTEGVLMVIKDRKWRTHLGCKIYKKSLFDHIEFPQGRVYGEDMIIHEIFHQASQTVFIDREYYFYLVRSDSISRQGDLQKEIKKHFDAGEAHYERFLFIDRHPEYHSLLPASKSLTIYLLISALHNMVALPQFFPQGSLNSKVMQLISIPLSKNDKISIAARVYRIAARISPKCYLFIRTLSVFRIKSDSKTNKKNYFLLSDIWAE